MHNISHRAYLAVGMTFAMLFAHASATVSINVPLTAANWTTKGDVKFQKIEGFPHGLMENKGGAILNGLVFKNGTIDVDVMFGKGISTIIFRRDDDAGEALVLRPQPNCPASNDCIQYTPVMHGAFLWDLYPQYQTKAPLSDKAWNHIRIVAAGKRMKVFMNGLSQPVLYIDRMAGTLGEGSLRLSGPASWANLVITPDADDGLRSTPAPDPSASDHHIVRTWNVSQSVHVATTVDKKVDGNIGTLPSSDLGDEPSWKWRHLVSEIDGLVNLSREVGSSKKGDEVSGVWLSTIVRSDRDQTKHVHLGWVREIAVFANGEPVFQERNLYGSPAQKEPDGRLGLENGQFDLRLRKGENTVRVFIDDNFGAAQHFGWGMKMRLDDISGVHFQS